MIKALFALVFRLSGWTYKSDIPENIRSFIFIGAPHTSNHDFIPAMAVAYYMRRNAKFVIKNDWMKFPMNLIMGPLGAIGLDRSKLKEGAQSNTDVMANLFKQYPELVLMIAPEGTRSANPKWKTGFYYMAQKANVPIVLGYADFGKKVAGLGAVIYPTHFEDDMIKIMQFYSQIQGRIPANFVTDSRYQG